MPISALNTAANASAMSQLQVWVLVACMPGCVSVGVVCLPGCLSAYLLAGLFVWSSVCLLGCVSDHLLSGVFCWVVCLFARWFVWSSVCQFVLSALCWVVWSSVCQVVCLSAGLCV